VRVKSIKLTNFKKFKDEHFEFNDDVNIFVGDNNAGKSTYHDIGKATETIPAPN